MHVLEAGQLPVLQTHLLLAQKITNQLQLWQGELEQRMWALDAQLIIHDLADLLIPEKSHILIEVMLVDPLHTSWRDSLAPWSLKLASSDLL